MLRPCHEKRITIDAIESVGAANTEKEMLEYSPEQARILTTRYIGDRAVESFFCADDPEQTVEIILELNDVCDSWLIEFAEIRSQLVDFAGEDHHKHSYFNQLSNKNKSCSDQPEIRGIDRWPFLDDVLDNFPELITRIVNYLSPNLSSDLDYIRTKGHYSDLTDSVHLLGEQRCAQHPQLSASSDEEVLAVGIKEIIRATTYVGHITCRPTGKSSRKEQLIDPAQSTLFAEMEKLLHDL